MATLIDMDDATPPERTRGNLSREVGIRELRDHLSRYVAAVRDGDEIVVTDHGTAVARLVPLAQPRAIDRLIAAGIVTPAINPDGPLPTPIKVKGTVSDLVAEQRR